MERAIVHEAEVQRQHARYRLPAQAQFGEHLWEVLDWSVGGFAIAMPHLDIGLGLNRTVSLRMIFPLEDYDIVMPVQAEVRNVDRERGRIGLRFVNTTPRQVSVLRYIIDAFLSGELVSLGDVMDVTARSHEAPSRAIPTRDAPTTLAGKLAAMVRTGAGYALVGGVTLALALFVFSAVYERLFVSRPIASTISTDTITIAAPVTGQVEVVASGTDLVPGQPAVAVRDWNQKQFFVEAKCACPIVERIAEVGSTIQEGAVVLRAAVVGAKPYVRAVVDDETLIRLRSPGAVARIQYADGTTTTVDLSEHPPTAVGVAPIPGSAATAAVVAIDAGRDLPLDLYGMPVRVRFDSIGSTLFGRLFG